MTLIELMVTIAIAAILAGLAAPSFKEMMANNQLKSHASSLLSSLLQARGEAIKRNGQVVLCKSATGSECTTAGGWQQGWVMFADADGDGVLDAGESVIQRTETLTGNFSLTAISDAVVVHRLTYAGSGSANGEQEVTFSLCKVGTSSGKARDIVLSPTGRPKIVEATVESCT
ncbi:MAG: GspH/FimT family pseudopilin [Hydrogenophaga sp.]|nr:GspH/FimT family pseudopilin [Hydrogenophaga sp.]